MAPARAPSRGNFRGRYIQRGSNFGGLFQQARQIEDLAGFERGALDSEHRQGSGEIRDGIEAQANGRAARRGLGLLRRAHILDGLLGVGQGIFESRAILMRRQAPELFGAERAAHKASQQFAQAFELEQISAEVLQRLSR